MIYLLNFNITYIITFATCFDSYESFSGINFKTYLHIVLQFLCLTVFWSNYCNRDPFLHYKTRVNVYMVLGTGVVGSCFGVRYCSYLGGGGFHALVNLLVALVFGNGMSSCQT